MPVSSLAAGPHRPARVLILPLGAPARRPRRTRPAISLVVLVLMLALGLPAVSGQEEQPTPPTATDDRPRMTPSLPEEDYIAVSLSLDEAIAIALEKNLDLRVERLNRDSALHEKSVTIAAFDPIFSTGFTVTKFREATVSFLSGVSTGPGIAVNPFESQTFTAGINGLLPIGTNYNVHVDHTRSDNPDSTFFSLNPRYSPSVAVELTQPLLKNFGTDSNLADYRIAAQNHEISTFQLRRLVETTLAEVVNAYWDVVFALENLAVREQSLEEAEQLLEINRQKANVGTATLIDVYDAEANIEEQKSGIIEARAELDRLQDEFLDLLNYGDLLREQGLRPLETAVYEKLRIAPTTELETEPVEIPGDSIPRALEHRADVRQAELSLENSQIDLRRRQDQLWPTLDLRGTYTQDGLEDSLHGSVDELASGRFYSWSLGLLFEIPLGNRAEQHRLFQARNNEQAAELNLQRTKNTVVLEVRQALRDLESAWQRIQTTSATVRLRSEQLEGEKQRLRVGSSTSYNVLQLQNDLLEARSQEVQARVDYRKAIMSYYRAMGTVLSRLGITVE